MKKRITLTDLKKVQWKIEYRLDLLEKSLGVEFVDSSNEYKPAHYKKVKPTPTKNKVVK